MHVNNVNGMDMNGYVNNGVNNNINYNIHNNNNFSEGGEGESMGGTSVDAGQTHGAIGSVGYVYQ